MTITSDAPADTTMMRIVHDALRRDLSRASSAIARPDQARGDQRRAIGAHLTWMMHFLHAHHASEDDGLYPLVRQRAGAADGIVEVLDRMARHHEAIAPAAAAVEAAAMALAASGSDDATHQTRDALDALGAVLLPHLQEEEDDAMPITVATDHRSRVAGDREESTTSTRSRCPISGSRVTGSSTSASRRRPRHGARARASYPAVHPAARLRTAISPPLRRVLG